MLDDPLLPTHPRKKALCWETRERERERRSIDRSIERTNDGYQYYRVVVFLSSSFFPPACASVRRRRNTRRDKTRGKRERCPRRGFFRPLGAQKRATAPTRGNQTSGTHNDDDDENNNCYASLLFALSRESPFPFTPIASRFIAAVMRCLSFLFVFPKATTTTLTDDDDGLFQRHLYFSVERGKRPSCTTIGTFFGTAAWHSRGRNWMHPS